MHIHVHVHAYVDVRACIRICKCIYVYALLDVLKRSSCVDVCVYVVTHIVYVYEHVHVNV